MTASPCFPVTVLTPVTKNREQEVMLSSPVSLAPQTVEQSGCQIKRATHFGYGDHYFGLLIGFCTISPHSAGDLACVKNTYIVSSLGKFFLQMKINQAI